MKQATRVLVVDDDAAFRRVLAGELQRSGYEVNTAGTGEEAVRAAGDHQPEIVLLDLRLPDGSGLDILARVRQASPASEVIMLTGHGSIDTAIEAIRAGAFDYVSKPCPLDELDVRIVRALERQRLQARTAVLERGLAPADGVASSFIGVSPAFRALTELVARVGASDSSVLVTGETGSGKEMVAKRLHAHSARCQRPFVVVECAALQESLLQSELFGHERGAFTGADRAKPGLFEVAHQGTIFLDEIGEVTPATQVKLLRVLDTSTFRHVGGTREIQVDVRVIAATNRDLPALVEAGSFRQDLFYRLSTITVSVPPLRDRPGDVDVLVDEFVARFNARIGCRRHVSEEARELLRRHSWPGNVRELLHVVEAAIVVCGGDQVRPEHLPQALRGTNGARSQQAADGSVLTLDALERQHIERALRVARGHRGQAARMLGISERNLYRKLRDYGLG
ncbi:MAG: sigma-54-dependent transcriptional regulator [Bacteroidales bacterium]